MWVDVLCMSKWATKNVRILSSCMTSLSLHEPLFIAVTRLRLSHWNSIDFLASCGPTRHSCILWAQVSWPLCQVVAILGGTSIEATDFLAQSHSPMLQKSWSGL